MGFLVFLISHTTSFFMEGERKTWNRKWKIDIFQFSEGKVKYFELKFKHFIQWKMKVRGKKQNKTNTTATKTQICRCWWTSFFCSPACHVYSSTFLFSLPVQKNTLQEMELSFDQISLWHSCYPLEKIRKDKIFCY